MSRVLWFLLVLLHLPWLILLLLGVLLLALLLTTSKLLFTLVLLLLHCLFCCRLCLLQRIGSNTLCALQRVGSSQLRSLLQRVFAHLLYLLTDRIVSIDPHRIRAHIDRIALRCVVAYERRILRNKDIARLLPILAPITKYEHLLRAVINLDIAFQNYIVAITIVVERVAQQLLVFGEDITIFGEFVELLTLVERATVGIEVVLLLRAIALIPDVGAGKELSKVGFGIIDHRIARHLVLVITHLHTLHTDNLVIIGINITPIRFEHIIATYKHTTTRVAANACLGIEREVVGEECSIAIHHLYNLRIYLCLVGITVVVGSIAIDVGRATIYQHIAEALDMTLGVAHRTIGRDNRAVVMCSEVSHHDHNLTAVMLHLPALVGLHIDIVTLGGIARNGWSLLLLFGRGMRQRRQAIASCKDQTRQRHEQNRYGNNSSLHAYLLYFTQFLFEKSPPRNSGAM